MKKPAQWVGVEDCCDNAPIRRERDKTRCRVGYGPYVEWDEIGETELYCNACGRRLSFGDGKGYPREVELT